MHPPEGHKTAGRSPLTCVNGAKAHGEKRFFKTKSGQPWMFVHSFSAVITGMLLAGPIVPCGNILTQPRLLSLEIGLHRFFTKATGT